MENLSKMILMMTFIQVIVHNSVILRGFSVKNLHLLNTQSFHINQAKKS